MEWHADTKEGRLGKAGGYPRLPRMSPSGVEAADQTTAFPSEIFPCISVMLWISKLFTGQSSLEPSARDGKEQWLVAKCKIILTQQFRWKSVAPLRRHPLTPERYQLFWVFTFAQVNANPAQSLRSRGRGVYVGFTDVTWVTPTVGQV